MNSLDMISIYDVPNIKLDYVLGHCSEHEWADARVAESRYKTNNNLSAKDIRDANVKRIDVELNDLLRKEVDFIVNEYAIRHSINITTGEGYHVVRYVPGQFFAEHIDSTEEFPRKISAVLYLNDNYDGGTITFSNLNKSFKAKSNTLFVFPSSEEFIHSADPVTSGVKYCIVGFWS
jgi:predicted 2-oxoglutarate/Fe(II)-dependent dioxygenase YbiX